MKKRDVKKNLASILLPALVCVLFLSFVLAAHTISLISSGSVNETISNTFNVSVENTDALAAANITQVDIIIPPSFTFTSSSDGTSAGSSTFSDSGSTLTWSNDGLVMNLTTQYFWFDATASTPGDYNLTVSTTNSSGTSSTNLAVTVNDTTAPGLTFGTGSESDYANSSRTNIFMNFSATDEGGNLESIEIRLYNSSHALINSSLTLSSPASLNITSLSDGTYYYNATANDTLGFTENSATRTVTIDTTGPAVTLDSPSNDTSGTDTSYNFTFSAIDDVGITSCDLLIDGSIDRSSSNITSGSTTGIVSSTIGEGEHLWYVQCTDYSGNTDNSITRTVTVTSSDDDSGGSADQIYYPGTSTLISGYTKDYRTNWKMRFDVGNGTHTMNLDSFDDSAASATITVSSLPQTKTLSLQSGFSEWKVDVDGDNEYYNLKLTLTKVTSIRATITAQLITELIPEDERATESDNTDGTTNTTSPGEDSENEDSGKDGKGLRWYWWVLIILFILLVIAGIAFALVNKSKMDRKVFVN
jgi:hypothetical protein